MDACQAVRLSVKIFIFTEQIKPRSSLLTGPQRWSFLREHYSGVFGISLG
jgi:hypothetical protein